jgi:hypothetical protein
MMLIYEFTPLNRPLASGEAGFNGVNANPRKTRI